MRVTIRSYIQMGLRSSNLQVGVYRLRYPCQNGHPENCWIAHQHRDRFLGFGAAAAATKPERGYNDVPGQTRMLRHLDLGNAECPLCRQIDAAGMLDVQLVELRTDFAPDARLLRRVVDQRRTEPLQAMPAAEGEQVLASLDVRLVALARMTRLQFQLAGIRRLDHALHVDRRAVFDDGGRVFHGGSTPSKK